MSFFEEYDYNSWKELKDKLLEFPHTWVFRGQRDYKWYLHTSLDRVAFNNGIQNLENEFIDEFKRGASNYISDRDQPKSIGEWLSLMQHYGAPTRFLDFSNSPFIATYFAVENYNDGDSVLWAIDSSYLQSESAKIFFDKYNYLIKNKRIYFEDVLPKLMKSNDIECIFPIEPYKKNKRFHIQQGIFLCPGNSFNDFEDNLTFINNPNEYIKKIRIKQRWRGDILYDLDKMNITRESLFENLEGFSKRLTLYFDALFSYNVPYLREDRFIQNNKNNA